MNQILPTRRKVKYFFRLENKITLLVNSVFILFSIFFASNVYSQTTLINPATEGGFNLGNTFASNGWTVANEGSGPIKWVVGSAASSFSASGATTAANAIVTLSAANSNIAVGQIVYGPNIPSNTYVQSISGTTLTLSQNATTTNTNVTLGFSALPGSISVDAIQLTNASVLANSYTITLAAANLNISVGMLIDPIAGIIDVNTYVAAVNGTALRLSKPTLNSTTSPAQTLNFTNTGSSLSGNAAYVTNDEGASNSYGGYPVARSIYFYRDITTTPASEKAMTLTFDVKSPVTSGSGWQVWVAPITQTVTGTNTQVTSPFTYSPSWPGATLISFNSDPQVSSTKVTAFIPKSFAGTPFRLIFVWTNSSSAGTLSPAAIDNISLTSRVAEEITCAQSGLWSNPTTWDGGKVPTHADSVVLDDANESVIIDSRYTGCEDLILAGTNTLVQYAISTIIDDFTIYNDLNIAASGARFNNHDTTNGKRLNLGHNLDLGSGARFDSSIGSTSAFQGRLTLNGSVEQTLNVDSNGFIGGSSVGINSFANLTSVINQLEINNTATTSSNIVWNVPLVRIKSNITLTSARINVTSGNRFVIGNFSSLTQTNFVCNGGSGFTNGLVSKWISSSNTYVVQPGNEYPGTHNNYNPYKFPFINSNGSDRALYLLPDANPSTAGEVAVLYTDSNTVTSSLAIIDGSYTINKRYEGNWIFSLPNSSATVTPLTFTQDATTSTFRLAGYVNGAFEAIDGTSRFMNQNIALAGTHQDGTVQPFVFRNGLLISDLTAAPIYVGIGSSSSLNTTSGIVSATSGNWNNTSTWVGGIIPSCTDIVTIASGHTVTVLTTANTAGIVISNGATLVNNSGANNMTVGCTNNNAAFYNYGTHTMTSGKLIVNGFVSHKLNSFFNQTGGEIIVDSNDNGVAATSVANGGTSFKIETSNLNLTDGKITIVDPLVNLSAISTTATSISDFTLNTAGATGFFTLTGCSATLGSSTITGVGNYNIFEVGQVVSGNTGIPANTTITNIAVNFISGAVTLTISNAVTSAIASQPLNFSSMINGGSAVVLEANIGNNNLGLGQIVSGIGIPIGSQITSIVTAGLISGPTSYLTQITLSNPITGLTTSPIDLQQNLSFAAVSPGAYSTILTAANASILVGSIVVGTGINPGTFVTGVSGTSISLSQPIQVGAPSPLEMSFLPFNTLSSGSFIYASSNNYATGLNHTLQIGDGISTQNTSIITNGFNCQFQAGGGLFSLGNLTIDAPNGNDRFMNVSSNNINNSFNMNVQNALTITAGSVFKKTFANSTVYVGGNIVNNGTINFPWQGTSLYLGNRIENVIGSTNLPQTISGSGVWETKEWALSSGPKTGYALYSLTINNSNTSGVTLQVPNFKVWSSVSLVSGILNTSDAYPIYCGIEDVTGTTYFGGAYTTPTGGSSTTYINGPCIHSNRFDNTIGQYKLFPIGKNGKYLPVLIASSGGVTLKAEAFDTNSGSTNSINASNLSTNRWKVTRVGTEGNFTGYNVMLGTTSPISASNIIVQAPTENGVYDVVSSPVSTTIYNPAYSSNGQILNLTTPQTGGLLGNFSYAEGPACVGTPTPGATIASATSVCNGQSVSLSLTTPTSGSSVTYQWQSSLDSGSTWTNITGAFNATYSAKPSTNTSYQCIVTCTGNSGTSTPVAITTTESTAVTTNGTTACDGNVANLSASGSTILNWYDAATGGNLVTVGNTYDPTITATTTYYVASANATISTINSGTYSGTTTASTLFNGIAFNVNNNIKLNSVRVYPKNTASKTPITISLYDATGTLVAGTTPVTFVPTLNTGTVGTVSQDVTLNYNIPIGTGYQLVVSNGLVATNNLLGKSTAAITYPTGSAVELLGNVTSLTAAVTTTANTTTYFHNLVFDEICESVTRTPVTASLSITPATPTITTTAATCSAVGNSIVTNYDPTLTYVSTPSGATVGAGGVITATAGTAYTFTTGTAICTSIDSAPFTNDVQLTAPATPTGNTNQTISGTIASEMTIEDLVVSGSNGFWYASEADALAATNALPIGTQLVTGTTYYTVNVSSNGCASAAFGVNVTVTLGVNVFGNINLSYYPNPVVDQLKINTNTLITKIEVHNLLGQLIKVVSTNSNNVNLELNELPSATYLVKVYSEDTSTIFKIIKK